MDQNTDIILSGVPDEIFTLKDKSYFILDYKTARYTEKQDTLLPVYEVQLNGYAYIAESKGLSPVKNIALAYMEPQTGLSQENVEEVITEEGFLLPFSGKIVMLDLKLDIIPELLKKVRDLYGQPDPPPGREECNDCQLLGNLIDILTQSKDKNA
ncbi:MAG: PD-(D/E)XK nuclease family protein [candidate division Zixibacteria bacterium]|nr:PD-(D/E)XK nuclease family protein [candidate division Zixibacteria bacterium]